jgi:prepilin-type N-terminal cleavage/methylation domain-containing protein
VRSLEEKDIPTVPPHRALTHRLRSLIADERGFNLVELLVVIPMVSVVLLGMYALYNVGAKGQQQNYNRVTTLLRDQNGLERVTREMRQATDFTPVSSQVLDATTWVRQPSDGSAAGPRRVRYECLSGSCTRYEGAVGSSLGTGETVITGVQNPDVFFFSPDDVNPNYLTVKLEVSVKNASNPIVLDGGFALRNLETQQ